MVVIQTFQILFSFKWIIQSIIFASYNLILNRNKIPHLLKWLQSFFFLQSLAPIGINTSNLVLPSIWGAAKKEKQNQKNGKKTYFLANYNIWSSILDGKESVKEPIRVHDRRGEVKKCQQTNICWWHFKAAPSGRSSVYLTRVKRKQLHSGVY